MTVESSPSPQGAPLSAAAGGGSEGARTYGTDRLSPVQSLSIPEYVEHHMVLDAELDRLTEAATSGLGSAGFTALGTCLGIIPNVGAAVAKITSKPVVPLDVPDVVSLVVFSGCLVACVICLAIHRTRATQTTALVEKIRARPRHRI